MVEGLPGRDAKDSRGLITGQRMRRLLGVSRDEDEWDLIASGVVVPVWVPDPDGAPRAWYEPADIPAAGLRLGGWREDRKAAALERQRAQAREDRDAFARTRLWVAWRKAIEEAGPEEALRLLSGMTPEEESRFYWRDLVRARSYLEYRAALPIDLVERRGKRVRPRLRFAVLARDGFACRYCGRTAPEVKLHVDHVTPKADGGTDHPDNLCAACSDCNQGKSDMLLDDPAT